MKHFLACLCAVACSTALLGQATWRRTFGGNGTNEGRCVRQTPDGDFVVAGSTGSFGFGASDIYLIKVSASGNLLWSRTYGDLGIQQGVSCVVLPDGFALAGTTNTGPFGGYDFLLLRLDLNGDVLWQKEYGTSDWDVCNDIVALNNGYCLVGLSYGTAAGAGDAWIVAVDPAGDTLWTRTLGTQLFDEALGVDLVSDGGVVVTGRAGGSGAMSDARATKFSESGALIWDTTMGGDSTDAFLGAVETSSGDFSVVGNTRSYSSYNQMLHGLLSANGDSIWVHAVGSQGDYTAAEIQMRPDGGFAIAGSIGVFSAGGDDMYLLLTDQNGDFQIGKNYGGLEDEAANSLVVLANEGYAIVGSSFTYGPGIRSVFLVKSDSIGETFPDDVVEVIDPLFVASPTLSSNLRLFPNPVARGSWIRIKELSTLSVGQVRVADALGQVVVQQSIGSGALFIDELIFSPGLYHIQADSSEGQAAGILIVL